MQVSYEMLQHIYLLTQKIGEVYNKIRPYWALVGDVIV